MSTRLHKERTGLMFSGAAVVDRMTVWRVLRLAGLGKEEALDMRAGGLKWLSRDPRYVGLNKRSVVAVVVVVVLVVVL